MQHGGTTTTLDYDAHQKFGVKGMVEFKVCIIFFSGRVESDEGSPNSVYCWVMVDSLDITVVGIAHNMRSHILIIVMFVIMLDTGNGDVQYLTLFLDGRIYLMEVPHAFNGADYAEYFEWADGNPNNEDRRGYPVHYCS